MRTEIRQQNNFKGLNNALGMFYNPNATIPTLAIETGVTLGRAQQANKRGGKQEAVERLVEQGVSALVWIYGVQILKKLGDKFGKSVLKIKDLNFDVGRDFLRNPIKNNKINPKAMGFKVGNILLSTTIATIFIGFVLPKINHKISSLVVKKEKQKKKEDKEKETQLKPTTLEDFKKNSKNISFTSLGQKGLFLAHTLENNQTARLLITDVGVVGGRFYNSRNKYEKIESLFRDISSIYFYLFSSAHIVKLFNKLTGNTDIDPKVLDYLSENLIQNISKKGRNIDKYNLVLNAVGNVGIENSRKLDSIFKDKKTISVEEFISHFPKLSQKAKEMATLQPIFEGNGVLTKTQALDVLSKGWVTNPEFLKKAMCLGTKGKASDKLSFVSYKKLENIRKSIDDFVKQIQEIAVKKNKKIDAEFIKKIANKNKLKNLSYNIAGTGFAIFALAYLIPKVQYLITKKLTNEDKFPGASE